MRSHLRAVLVLASATALSAQSAVTWRIHDVPPELRLVVSRADLMIAAMHDSVLRELADELSAVGPDKAIDSCHVDSRLIIHRFGREGVAAGRTSDRLRNPTNAPPAWARTIVAANAGRRASDVEGFAVDLGDRLGVLRPISQRPMCANCHGPSDRLTPAVRTVLAERYPADKAVGFKQGEIRGWFWVEMPKTAK